MNTQSNPLFEAFPKSRPPLPETIQKIYNEHYKINRQGQTPASSIAQRLESWMHKKVAANKQINNKAAPDYATLEIGAGTLNHLNYEPPSSNYDIIEPMKELYENTASESLARKKFSDILEISGKHLYDRIISVAVLEHVLNLPELISASCTLLKKDGTFCCGIPSEGGFLWGLAWRLSTRLEFRLKYNADYGALMRHEHVNNAMEIEGLLRVFFANVRVTTFGMGKHFSLYKYIECKEPIKQN